MTLDPLKLDRALARLEEIFGQIHVAFGEGFSDAGETPFDSVRGLIETLRTAVRTGSDIDLEEAINYPLPDWES